MAHNTEELVNAFTASGMSRKEFCVQRGMNVSVLQYHLDKVRSATNARKKSQGTSTGNGEFIPEALSVSYVQVVMILEGIDLRSVKRKKRYELPT